MSRQFNRQLPPKPNPPPARFIKESEDVEKMMRRKNMNKKIETRLNKLDDAIAVLYNQMKYINHEMIQLKCDHRKIEYTDHSDIHTGKIYWIKSCAICDKKFGEITTEQMKREKAEELHKQIEKLNEELKEYE